MFNRGVRGRRSRDGEGNSTIRSNFVEKKFPIPFISGFEISGQSDLNVDTQGGQTVIIIGNGFSNGLTLTLDGVAISPVTVISGSRVSFTAPAKSAGTYPVVISNTNGASAILVPGIVFGESPIFSTAAGNIGNFYETKSISSTVSATSDSGVTYEIVSGSIPPGSTLSSSGVLSGTAPVEANSSTYTFTVKATDEELQSSTRQFNVTVNTDVVTWGYPTNGATVVLDDAEVSLNLSASSAAGYPVTYSADSLPQGFSLSSNGAFTGTVTEEETVSSTLTATADTTNRTASITVNWSLRLGDAFIGQTSLLLSGAASTVITDASDNQLVITPSGDFRPSALNPFDQGWATYIDGSDYYEVPQNSSLAFQGGGAFTWETFINFTTGGLLYGSYTGPSNAGGSFSIGSDHVNKTFSISWIVNGTDGWNFDNAADSNILELGKWHHIAISYDGAGTLRYFVDGELATVKSVTVNVDTMVYNVRIGRSSHPSYPAQFVGWLSNMRFVKGLCLYTESFTPPDSGLTPVSGTVFLGFTTGNALYDASLVRNTIARSGTTEERQVNGLISSKITEPISYSIYFDGVDDYIYSTTPMLPSTSTSTFTIEGWFYTPSAPGDRYMIFGDGQPTVNEFNIGVQLVSNRTLRLAWYNGSQSPYSFSCSTTGTANLNSWNWFAVVVNNNAISIYLNSATPQGLSGTTTLSNRTSNKYMMAGLQQTSLLDYLGYISNIRVSTIARTIAAVPTAPYETDPDTRWLVAKSNTLIDLSGNSHDPIVAGNQAKLTTANPFGYTTSALPDGLGSGYFDGTGDWLTTTIPTGLGGNNFTIEFWGKDIIGSGNWGVFSIGAAAGLDYAGITMAFDGDLYISTTGTSWQYQDVGGLVTAVDGQWHHYAIVRNGGSLLTFQDGALIATTPISGSLVNRDGVFYLGRKSDSTNPVSGYFSNFRIVNGTALYTANFTPPTSPLTAVSGTSLLTLQSIIGYNNSQPIDLSGFKNVITRNGNASVGAFSPHVPTGWSAYFDGDGDYIQIADNPALNLGTGDFTIEAWIYWIPRSGSTFPRIMAKGDYQVSTGSWRVQLSNASGSMGFNYGSSDTGLGIGTLASNTWGHICIIRSGTTIKTYLNGVFNATIQSSVNYDSTYPVKIGAGENLRGGEAFNGYVSNFRILKGTALHTGGSTSGDVVFTPPTAPLEPITNTSLLTLRGPSFTDDGPRRFAITRNGDTKITPFSPFKPHTVTPDSYSVYFDGTGDFLEIADNTAFDFGSGSFTVECWVNFAALPTASGASTFISQYSSSSATDIGWFFYLFNSAGTYQLYITYSTTGTNQINLAFSLGSAPDIGTWNHVAFVRSGNDALVFWNGIQVGSTQTLNATLFNSSRNIRIGAETRTTAPIYPLNGYISNVRIVKGTALYTENFDDNLPTEPLTAVSGTSLLTCQSPTVIDNSTNRFAITVNDNCQPTKFNPFGETVTTGGIEYSPTSHGGSVYFDGTTDYLTVPDSVNFDLPGDFTAEFYAYATGSNARRFFQIGDYRSGQNGLLVYSTTGNAIVVYINGAVVITGPTLIPYQWVHVACVREGTGTNNLKLYVNGALAGQVTNTVSFTGVAGNGLVLGAEYGGSFAATLETYISNFRLVKGTALYTSAFVPPQAPVDPVPGTTLLTCDNNAAIQDKTGRNVLETVGNARTLPESPYRLNKSVYFAGTDDYLSTGTISDYKWLHDKTSDYTIEFWMNPNDVAGRRAIIETGAASASSGVLLEIVNGTLQYNIYRGVSGSLTNSSTSASSIIVGQWYFVSIVVTSTEIKIYLNGNLEVTTSWSLAGSTSNQQGTLLIAGDTLAGDILGFVGYISNLRIVKDTTITPPAGGPTSPLTAVSGTQLLTCQSYNFKDNSTNDFTITRNGDAKISSRGPFAETQTSDNAMSFDGTGDYLVGYNLDSFAVGDFTVEAWVYFNANSSTGYSTIFAGSGLSFYVYNLARLDIWPGPSPVSQVNYTFSVGQWYHIVYARSNNTFYFYVNGTRITGANSSTIYTGSTFSIGGINSPTHYLNGYIEDLRITKGVARYNLDFDPPTSRYKAK